MAYTTINKSSDYFNTKLYTGNGGTQSLTGVTFQPDWVWVKERGGANSHMLCDVVRGVTKILFSNLANAQDTDANSITAFGSDGFSVGSSGNVNASGDTYVGWNWKAGGTASSNTDGTITSSVSASTTAGFSIVSWTGTGANATVGHGLGSVPKMIMVKNRASAENWIVGHTSIDWTKYLSLNTTDVTSTASNIWQDTTPTSSVFSIGASGKVNGSSNEMIAYCFADVKGFSKFGKYVGNGNADGTFVYTGFKPSFVLMKNTADSGANWQMFDNKRDVSNVANHRLFPNADSSESTDANNNINFLSNGFKMKTSNGDNNANGSTFIYMAFSEAPLVGTNNVPATAR